MSFSARKEEGRENQETPGKTAPRQLSSGRKFLRRILRISLLLFFLLLLCVGYDYYRFKTGQPKITVNYALQQDQEVLKIPEEDRGWPLYREALSKLLPEWKKAGSLNILKNSNFYRKSEVGDPQWLQMVEWMKEHRDEIDLFLEAASKPHIGYVSRFSDPEFENYEAASRGFETMSSEFYTTDRYALNVTPYRYGIRYVAWPIFLVEAVRAEKVGDHKRLTEIISGWLNLSKQLTETGEPLYDSVDQYNYFATRLMLRLLTERPELFTDEELEQLQQSFSEVDATCWRRRSYNQYQLEIDDNLQRFYAGEEPDDTFLCDAAFEQIPSLSRSEFRDYPGTRAEVFQWMLSNRSGSPSSVSWLKPVMQEMVAYNLYRSSATKAEVRKKCFEILECARRDSMKPWDSSSELEKALKEIKESPVLAYKYWIVLKLMEESPPNHIIFRRKEIALHKLRINTVVSAIALERYHRKYQKWPDAMDALIPEFLEEIPLDPFVQQPLSYVVKEGQPYVYSLGANGTDEEGEIIKMPEFPQWSYGNEQVWSRKEHIGDFRLFPFEFPAHY